MTITAAQLSVLNRLLDQALDLQPDQRMAWVDTLSADYDALRPTLRELLSGRAGLETTDILRRVPEPPLAIAAGHMVGPYRLLRELGVGGMATVWLAERADGTVQRQVALKLPRVAWHDAANLGRMLRERDILASLEHPHIARLYDAGADSSGRPYLALEYVDGVPLQQYVQQHVQTPRQLLQLFLKIARAVAFAHGRLIVHRDLKPSNILVKNDGEVSLLDFGIARLLQNDVEQGAQHTQFSGRALTPRYAAPEQFTNQPITVAADVYSLGVLLYELLTGISPYFPKRDSHAALEDSVLHDAPPLPSDVAKFGGRMLRGDLDGVLLKALQKEPLDRYPSVEAFAADIEHYLAGRPVTARPASRWYRSAKFVRRNRLVVGAATVALLAVVGGATVAVWQARAAAIQRDHAVAHASRAAAINDFMHVLIADAAASDQPVTVAEMLKRSEALALANDDASAENRAAILDTIAELYFSQGDTGKSVQLLEHALTLVGSSPDAGFRSDLNCEYAVMLSNQGQSAAAAAIVDREIENLRSDPDRASGCLLNRSEIAAHASDAEGALRYALLSLDRLRQADQVAWGDEAVTLGQIASSYRILGDNRQADRYFQLTWEKYVAAGRERSQDATTIANNWALVSQNAGVPKLALAHFDQALSAAGSRDSNRQAPPTMICNRAFTLESLGRYAAARDAYELGYQLANRDNNLRSRASCLGGLASIAVRHGDPARAVRYLDQSTKVSDSKSAASLPRMASTPLLYGKVALATGKLDAARAEFDHVLEKKRKNQTTIDAGLGKAEVELLVGDVAAANGAAQAALELATSLQGGVQHSNYTGLAWLTVGRVLQARGELGEARKAFETAVDHLSNTVDADHPELLRARQLLSAVR
jgi:eukaryotic-like serine/threonine-protein kinase